jgi:hypothetical protein
MTATMSAMMAIVRVFMGSSDVGSVKPGTPVRFAPGVAYPFPAAGPVQSLGSYGSSTPRATRTVRRSG